MTIKLQPKHTSQRVVFLFLILALPLLQSCTSASTQLPSSGASPKLAFPATRYTSAPLQSVHEFQSASSCSAVFRTLLLDPETLFQGAHIRWEFDPKANFKKNGLPPIHAIRSYHVEDIRIAEKVLLMKNNRTLALSYLPERSSSDWPISEHLAIIQLRPQPPGCQGIWLNYFNVPKLSLDGNAAKNKLTKEIIPKAIQKLAQPIRTPRNLFTPQPTERARVLPSR